METVHVIILTIVHQQYEPGVNLLHCRAFVVAIKTAWYCRVLNAS